MSHPDVTLGEVIRRVEKVERDCLPQPLAAQFRVTDQAYVGHLENRIRDLEDAHDAERKQRASDRRLVFGALLSPLLVAGLLFILDAFRTST